MVRRIILSADMIRVSRSGFDVVTPPVVNEETMVFSSEYNDIDKIHAHMVLGPYTLYSGKDAVGNPYNPYTFNFPALSRIPNVHLSIYNSSGGVYNQSFQGGNAAGTTRWGHAMLDVYLNRVRLNSALIWYQSIYGGWAAGTDVTANGAFYYAMTVFKP